MRNARTQAVIALCLLAAAPAPAVVDIAPVEVGATRGVSGHVAAAFVAKNGNTDSDEYDLDARLLYDSARSYVTFVQGTYERTVASEVETEDESFIHARYLWKWNGLETLYGEVFAQYWRDPFKSIDARLLGGGNIRWRFLSGREWGKLYVGAGAFQETIDYTEDSPESSEAAARLNTYLAYTHDPTKRSTVSLIGYYQPAFENIDDRYMSAVAEFTVHIASDWNLVLSYEIDYDTRPPAGVEKDEREFKVSLAWKF